MTVSGNDQREHAVFIPLRLREMISEMASLLVVNIVVSFTLQNEIDISNGYSYNGKKFSGLIRKVGSKTLLIFRSGKVNVTGVVSLMEAIDLIETVFPEQKITQHRISNMTTSFTLPVKIDNQRLLENCKSIQYEPECFPGMYWRQPGSRIIVIFFHSGKGIITGSSNYVDLYGSYLLFLNEVLKFRQAI